ncbi:MAG: putative cytosol aminopeptidase [Chlamydiia bacterium]|nr:putative cytosol aminopeptidase [Chlamydiia bacterium]
MQVESQASVDYKKIKCDVVVIPVDSGAVPLCDVDVIDWGLPALTRKDVKGSLNGLWSDYAANGMRVLFVGLGEIDKLDARGLRIAYAKAMKRCMRERYGSVAIYLPTRIEMDGGINAVIGGLLNANYTFDWYRTQKQLETSPKVVEEILFVGEVDGIEELIHANQIVAEAKSRARDWVNGNANQITPTHLANDCEDMAADIAKLKASIYDRKHLEKLEMGLMCAVAEASREDPKMIILEYHGNPDSSEEVVLVGKGITYDTGGLSLKPNAGMLDMKTDMAAAAAVLAAIEAIARLELKVNVCAIVGATENAIDSNSYKPGDVYTGMNGVTVEVTNTDAEGRMVLADLLCYAEKYRKPSCIVDFATLTGACVVALGEEYAGCFARSDWMADALNKAGDSSCDEIWRMPLSQRYGRYMKSSIAHMKNAGSRYGGSCTAAWFLGEFVETTEWVHIDMASKGNYEMEDDCCGYSTAGGFGVGLIVDFVKGLQ